jgi:hypothetical protein
MASPPCITLIIKAIDSNERYNRFFPSLTQPIFLSGDSISGHVRVIFPASQPPPTPQVITVQLVGKSCTLESLLHRFVVSEFKPDSPIRAESSFDFTFDHPPIPYPSYHGTKCSVIYQICLEVKGRFWSKPIQKSETIVILEPIKVLNPPTPIEITVAVVPVRFSLTLDHLEVFSDDEITGKVVLAKPQPMLESVFIKLMVTEKWIDGMQNKSDERELLNYELIDGAPFASPGIPFVIRLGKLHLWTYPGRGQKEVHVFYRLDVMVKVNHVMKVAATQQITIVQPML